MANLIINKTVIIGFNLYAIAVSGTVITGETYTVNSTLGIICQYTAVSGDDNNSVATAMQGLINPTYTSGLTPPPAVFAFRLPYPNEVTSAPTSSPPAPPPTPPTVITLPQHGSIIYGLRFQCTFDPPAGGPFAFKPRYRLEIHQKNYSGSTVNVMGAEIPVVHNWLKDEIKPGIQGSSLSIQLVNDGTIPLNTFYTVDDNEFLVRFYWLETGILINTIDRKLFEGYLVQDNSGETMVDYNHPIKLTATDGLGLLKGITLDKAPASYEVVFSNLENYEITVAGGSDLLVSTGFGDQLQVGDKISIDNGPQYTVKTLVLGGSVWNVVLVENVAPVLATTGTLTVYRSSLLDKITLLSVIKRCLSATGLQLKTNIYCNLLEYNQLDTSSFLEQTLIDPQSFLKNNTEYDNCYSILEKIYKSDENGAMLSIFQAEGVWNIVRWDELRYYSNLIPGFSYDSDMTLIGPVTLPSNLTAGIGEEMYAENGLERNVTGPLLFTKEQFDFNTPPHLLRNNDLQILGSLLRNYTSGTGADFRRTKEYSMRWYDAPEVAAVSEYFIRIVYDLFDNEVERYAVIKYDRIKSYFIEASEGDIINLSFGVRAMYPTGGNVKEQFFVIKLTDGTQTLYIQKEPSTIPPLGEKPVLWGTFPYTYEYLNGEYQQQWTDIEIKSISIPFDGKLTVYLTAYPKNPINNVEIETHYRDIRFSYTAFINDSTKIIGQTHKSDQGINKQTEDKSIYVDDSPRNFIAGTLFLNELNGVIQKRTSRWKRAHIPLEKRKLGNITTFEQLFLKRKFRTVLEGTFYGLLHLNNHTHVSLLSVFKYTYFPELNFVFGRLAIDYKHNKLTCTMQEMYADGEVDGDLASDYEFKYLYEAK